MDESPVNNGAVCAKGHAAPQWVSSPDRLIQPLKRIGKKGEGKFEKTSWDAAIDRIAEVLAQQKKTFGAESLAILSPARRSYVDTCPGKALSYTEVSQADKKAREEKIMRLLGSA